MRLRQRESNIEGPYNTHRPRWVALGIKMTPTEAIFILSDLQSELDEFPVAITRNTNPRITVILNPLRGWLGDLLASMTSRVEDECDEDEWDEDEWDAWFKVAWKEFLGFQGEWESVLQRVDHQLGRARQRLHCHDSALMELEALQTIMSYYEDERHIMGIRELVYVPELLAESDTESP